MPRLIDRLMREDFPNFSKVKDLLSGCVHLSIDNVAKHYYEESPKDVWHVDSFPNIAPPFDTFFMEYRTPNFINVNGVIKESRLGKNHPYVGMLFNCMGSSSIPNGVLSDFGVKKENANWLFQCTPFIWSADSNDTVTPIFCVYVFLVDSLGQMCKRENGECAFATGFFEEELYNMCKMSGTNPKEFAKFVSDDSNNAMAPFLLSLSFMHCKNVTTKQVMPDAPVSKKYQKKHGRPLEKYYILDIEPMKKVLRTEGNSEKTGLKQALHICRGHFKDFSQGKGLFGKFNGLYWWDSQVRGSHKHGVIDKDYNVKRPKESNG